MSSKTKITSIQNYFTSDFKRRPQNDLIMKHFLDVDDKNSSTEERLSKEETNWQHELDQFLPPEPRIFPKNKVMSLTMTQFTSFGKSDDELFNPLPLGF